MMNLRQLQYIVEIAQQDDLSISAVAAKLHANQPGISKQLQSLEKELGVQIFGRSKNRLVALTAEGARIVDHAQAIINEVQHIKAIGRAKVHDRTGPLVIAVTHTQARYVLAGIIKAFAVLNPNIRQTMRYASPSKIGEMLLSGEADIGITTNEAPGTAKLVSLPLREFKRIVIVPRGHALLQSRQLTLKQLAQYSLVTYEPSFSAREVVMDTFRKAGLEPTVVVSALDSDVIKTCVEQGLGFSVVNEIVYDPEHDSKLAAIPADHLFPPSVTNIWLPRHRELPRYMYDFIELCLPALTRARVEEMTAARTGNDTRFPACARAAPERVGRQEDYSVVD